MSDDGEGVEAFRLAVHEVRELRKALVALKEPVERLAKEFEALRANAPRAEERDDDVPAVEIARGLAAIHRVMTGGKQRRVRGGGG